MVLQVDFLSTLLQGRGQDGDTQGKLLNLTSDFSKSTTLRSRIVPCSQTQAQMIIKNLCVPSWQSLSGDWGGTVLLGRSSQPFYADLMQTARPSVQTAAVGRRRVGSPSRNPAPGLRSGAAIRSRRNRIPGAPLGNPRAHRLLPRLPRASAEGSQVLPGGPQLRGVCGATL